MRLTPALAAQLFSITKEPTGLLISFERCLKDDAVLRMRRAELCRCLVHVFTLLGPAQGMASHSALRVTCDSERAALVHTAWPVVARTLERIANRPCTPRMVVQLLGLLPQERIRWTEDGRLRTAGCAPRRRGPDVTCDTYPSRLIAHLAGKPHLIEEWRREDR